MTQYLVYLATTILAVAVRYQAGFANACQVVGVSISESGSQRGFQDAITPPESTAATLFLWLLTAAVLGYALIGFGWIALAIAILIFFAAGAVAGAALIPAPESSHYLGRIHRSLARRQAAFLRRGDQVRAGAISNLLRRVEETYGTKLY